MITLHHQIAICQLSQTPATEDYHGDREGDNLLLNEIILLAVPSDKNSVLNSDSIQLSITV